MPISSCQNSRPVIAILAQFPFDLLDGEMGGRGAGQLATWLPQLAMAWQKQSEFDLHWCVIAHKGKTTRTVEKWGQTFHLIPSPSITASMLLARWPQRFLYSRLFRRIKPDLIHCWGTENLYGAALMEFNGPSILSMQGIIQTCYRTGALKGWRWQLFKNWEPTTVRAATMVTCESQWGIDRIHDFAPGKDTKKIEYGVFPTFYEVQWNPDPSDPLILVAGGLNALKGTDILVKLLSQRSDLGWRIVFAGTGSLGKCLAELNHPKVELAGMLTTSELQLRMSRAWALVHPARADTSPNVVKEARVIGLPVIGSPHGGHSNYVEHGVDGFIVRSEDPDEWSSAIGCLASDFELTRKMGSVNHEKYRDVFQPRHTADSFLSLYKEMLTS